MFKIIVNQTELKKALSNILPTLGKGAKDVYDDCVYIECFKENNVSKLKVITTNQSEIGECVCNIVKNESTNSDDICSLVKFSVLYNLVESIPDGLDIIIKNDKNGEPVFINYKNRKKPIELASLDHTKFLFKPIEGQYKFDLTLPCKDLKECIDVASNVIVENDNYPIYTCANLTILDKQIVLRAMDPVNTKRMMIYSISTKASGKGNFLLHCESAKKILNTMNEAADVRIASNNNTILLEQDNTKYFVRLLNGQFAKIEGFMPNKYDTEIEFDKQELTLALKRIKSVADKAKNVSSCKFTLDNAFSSIEFNNTKGNILEQVVTTLNGSNKEIAFLIDSICKTVSEIKSNKIKFGFCNNKNNYAVLMLCGGKYIHRVLVPAVRIKK